MPTLVLSLFLAVGLVLSSPPNAGAKGADRSSVQRACAAMFGPAIDRRNGLFEVSRFYVLEVKFDARGHLAELGVVPKYWYVDDHPEWEEPDDFADLTEIEYNALLSRLEEVRPKGQLVERAKLSVVTNCTAHIRDRYENAVLETGEVVDLRRPEDAPRAIRYFILYFDGAELAK